MEIINTAKIIRETLKSEKDSVKNPIDLNMQVIPPFKGGKEVKLIFLGQDPTIKNKSSREKITCTLNLNKNNSLKSYIEDICNGLNLTLEDIYATNLYKYFYTYPPANTIEVLIAHLEPNLNFLKQELSEFANSPIITLGEPVLQLLTNEKEKVREYWDYIPLTGRSDNNFKLCQANSNKLKRDFFPFPHQPSIRKDFYKNTIELYIEFMKSKI